MTYALFFFAHVILGGLEMSIIMGFYLIRKEYPKESKIGLLVSSLLLILTATYGFLI
jgi:hypothetical protein